ncbi:MAG TPA: amino acid adenylation domain-containing protein [Candidatus Dormibacteraeota bacterium]|nr:amino acid adenylation domain-containing protein [Candidatus Dormibacteraeota bacterium]
MTARERIAARERELLERWRAGRAPAAGVPRRTSGDPAPMSFVQERLWIASQLEPSGTAYNVTAGLRLRGTLDAARLGRALDRTAARHTTLRSSFPVAAGAPSVRVADTVALPLTVLDAADETEGRRLAEAEVERPFDLGAAPLARFALVRLGPEDHVLAIAMHHIVSDGWSIAVLLRDLSALYTADAEARTPTLPDLPVEYADFATWQRARLTGAEGEAGLRAWRARLGGQPRPELVGDRPRPAVWTTRGEGHGFVVDPPVVAGLRGLARSTGATQYMVLLAALGVLLGGHTDAETAVVGSPIAGRVRAELEELVGCFVNTLVMTVDLRGDPSFAELVGRVREMALEAFRHQEIPFERLAQELDPDRDPGRTPLFQVALAYQSAPAPAFAAPGVRSEPFPLRPRAAMFDLSFTVTEAGSRLHVHTEYRADLFDRATIVRVGERLRTLLAAVATGPSRRLSALPLPTAEERELVRTWNRTAAPLPATTVHGLVAERAALRPDAPALTFAGRDVPYGELEAGANRLARHLVAAGVRPRSIVAVCLDRGPELLSCLLAVLEAGGAYLPLDPAYPPERLALMLADSGAGHVVTTSHLRARLPEALPPLVLLDGDAPAIARHLARAPDVAVLPDDLAYVMYTSGSTGRPKAVMVPHRAVVRLVRGAGHARMGADEVFALVAPASFDAATLEVWGALCNGARLAILPPGLHGPAELAAFLREHRVTVVWLTAGLFNQVAELAPEAFAGLRQVLTGGEPLSPIHARMALAAFPGLRIGNGYGPTECTTFTSVHEPLTLADLDGVAPIGRPIGNTRCRVLDRLGREVPVGVPGELHVGGPGLARGYLGRPGLTAERFVPDPAPERPGDRLYRTGDRVRWLPTGELEFGGRLDDQVKIRGHRVEPGEVEATLRQAPGVTDCAVVAFDSPVGRRLAAYVAGVDESRLPELRERLAARLPEYMLPATWQLLDRLPRNANGKVDRRALPAPAAASPAGRSPAPRTELEERVAGAWRATLQVQAVGIDDGFFDAGGNSLLLVRLQAELERVVGRQMSLVDLLREPTVRRQAAALAGGEAADESEVGVAEGRRRLRRRLTREAAVER